MAAAEIDAGRRDAAVADFVDVPEIDLLLPDMGILDAVEGREASFLGSMRGLGRLDDLRRAIRAGDMLIPLPCRLPLTLSGWYRRRYVRTSVGGSGGDVVPLPCSRTVLAEDGVAPRAGGGDVRLLGMG